jgi:hypothetical protein
LLALEIKIGGPQTDKNTHREHDNPPSLILRKRMKQVRRKIVVLYLMRV